MHKMSNSDDDENNNGLTMMMMKISMALFSFCSMRNQHDCSIVSSAKFLSNDDKNLPKEMNHCSNMQHTVDSAGTIDKSAN